MDPAPTPNSFPRIGRILAAIVFIAWVLLCTQPDLDGDLWFQLAYGRQMVADHTLIPNHSLYSWTPAANDRIYCAWFAEIALYLMHAVGGLPLLFILRYVAMAMPFLAAWWLVRRRGVETHLIVWTIGLHSLLCAQFAAVLKPQLFSFLFATLAMWLWMRIKAGGEQAHRWCWAFPFVMFMWVNSHGAFIFGAVLFLVIGIGEELNSLYSPGRALPLKVRQHLIGAFVVSSLAILATPYGFAYIKDLIASLTSTPAEHLQSVREYDSIFSAAAYQLGGFGLVSAVTLLALMVPAFWRRGVDWAILLATVVFAALFIRFLRTTIFWSPVYALVAAHLLADRPSWAFPESTGRARVLAGALVVFNVATLVPFAFQVLARPPHVVWFGYGISYVNPVEEAEYIDAHLQGCRLGNDYNSGSYLLWRLWPKTKVFIDSRYFPYQSWFTEYRQLETTEGIERLLEKYPCDAWCVVLPLSRTTSWFLNSPDWVPVFYGSRAAIFTRRDRAVTLPPFHAGSTIDEIKNVGQASIVLDFAIQCGDWAGADRILKCMDDTLALPKQRELIAVEHQWKHGTQLVSEHKDEEALPELVAARTKLGGQLRTAYLRACLFALTEKHYKAGDLDGALSLARQAQQAMPEDLYAAYNLAAVLWKAAEGKPAAPDAEWRTILTSFCREAGHRSGVPDSSLTAAREMLAGERTGTPPLIVVRTVVVDTGQAPVAAPPPMKLGAGDGL